MTRRAVGNPLALAVLAGLLTGPMHPYEMARRFVEYGKERDIKPVYQQAWTETFGGQQ
ncbi:hypothetical protein [Pseudonocardia sp. GCM10023141]|uniref:hypothetical protein n=1 Tax=Pseudonocardia sp. GCM10023141 TaxID=3252653 RepID=UPI00361955E5